MRTYTYTYIFVDVRWRILLSSSSYDVRYIVRPSGSRNLFYRVTPRNHKRVERTSSRTSSFESTYKWLRIKMNGRDPFVTAWNLDECTVSKSQGSSSYTNERGWCIVCRSRYGSFNAVEHCAIVTSIYTLEYIGKILAHRPRYSLEKKKLPRRLSSYSRENFPNPCALGAFSRTRRGLVVKRKIRPRSWVSFRPVAND